LTFLVDTNVLIYGAEQSGLEHARCRELVLGWQRRLEPWYTTWPILYEFMRISTLPLERWARASLQPANARDYLIRLGAVATFSRPRPPSA
jgi:predicted nucleic acid-binding protein